MAKSSFNLTSFGVTTLGATFLMLITHLLFMKTIGNTAKKTISLTFYMAAIWPVILSSIPTGSWAQTLGNYPNKTIAAGLNTTVVPAAAPVWASSVVAYTLSPVVKAFEICKNGHVILPLSSK
jgi:hypothetical protein